MAPTLPLPTQHPRYTHTTARTHAPRSTAPLAARNQYGTHATAMSQPSPALPPAPTHFLIASRQQRACDSLTPHTVSSRFTPAAAAAPAAPPHPTPRHGRGVPTTTSTHAHSEENRNPHMYTPGRQFRPGTQPTCAAPLQTHQNAHRYKLREQWIPVWPSRCGSSCAARRPPAGRGRSSTPLPLYPPSPPPTPIQLARATPRASN